MASNNLRKLKKTESKKSHSWWWDSHISPKNNKWLQENLEEMDQYVKRMLKLIEEDADSFSKKAELYFKKRPELLHLVEEFYRMYRSLAERYDHVTGELRKRVPSGIQSQDSGVSEANSEPPLSSTPSPDQRPRRTKSGPRAAGFDFFLGDRKNSMEFNSSSKGEEEEEEGEGDETSSLDSESESDDSSVNNYSVSQQVNEREQELTRKITELEDEIQDLKERVKLQEQEISEGCKKPHYDDNDEFEIKIVGLEEKLSVSKEKVQQSEQEITRLKDEILSYKSLVEGKDQLFEDDHTSKKNGSDVSEVDRMSSPEAEISDSAEKIRVLEEELRVAQDNLSKSEDDVARLRQELMSKHESIQNIQDQLNSSQNEVSTWKDELEKEKREITKLQDRIARYKNNLSERDEEIRQLKEAMSNANKALSEENERLQSEITRITKEKTYLEHNIKEIDLRCQSLEDGLKHVKAAKSQIEEVLGTQIVLLKVEISEKNKRVEELNKEFDAFKLKYDTLMSVKDNLNAKIETLGAEISSRDDRIDQMNNHLHNLHLQLVELISKAEEAKKIEDKLKSKVKELEMDIEKKRVIIIEGAEEKREAIRQLCFSLEHYRSSYDSLRKAVVAHKRPTVMAS